MSRWSRLLPILALLLAAAVPAVQSQMAKQEKAPPRARVAIYHVAPGMHLEFLKWLAISDEMDKEAGVPAAVLYAHTDGDAWDYLQIGPALSKEQQDKIDAVTKKHGHKIGFASSLEFRSFISSHTDTFAIGPVSAADLVAEAAQ